MSCIDVYEYRIANTKLKYFRKKWSTESRKPAHQPSEGSSPLNGAATCCEWMWFFSFQNKRETIISPEDYINTLSLPLITSTSTAHSMLLDESAPSTGQDLVFFSKIQKWASEGGPVTCFCPLCMPGTPKSRAPCPHNMRKKSNCIVHPKILISGYIQEI